MAYTVNISDAADSDLEDIFYWIAQDNMDRAFTFLDELTESFMTRLGTFPLAGEVVNEQKNIRKGSYKRYTAFYHVSEELKHVEILHVVNLGKPLEVRGIDFNG